MPGQLKKTELVRGLSLTAAIMIVVGSVIGSGIFRKPSIMAQQLGSPELMIIVWVAAGFITLIAALVNAEVSGMIDATGGQYVYFKKMYGDFTSYIYGWSILSVIQTGSQAAIAYVFAEYVGYFVKYPQFSQSVSGLSLYIPLVGNIYPLADFGTKAVAIICLAFLTGVNYIGVVFGGKVQTVVTYVKILSIILISAALLIFGNGSLSNVYTGFELPTDGTMSRLCRVKLRIRNVMWDSLCFGEP